MACKIKYIEDNYRKNYPELADKLFEIHNNVWRDVINSKLFTQKGNIPAESTYLYSKIGTEANKKQIAFINSITAKYGAKVIYSKPTESGYNKKVIVGVNSLAQLEYDKLQKPTQASLFQLNNTPQVENESLQEGLNWLKDVNPNVQPEIVQGLIDGIANGSYNSSLDLITLSEEFANKKTVKHEYTHLTIDNLFETKEHYVLDKMIKNGIVRKEC